MKFRAAPIIYRAVCEGLVTGLQEVKAQESAPPEQIVDITASAIMVKLSAVLVFDEEDERMANIQRIAEEMAQPTHATATSVQSA